MFKVNGWNWVKVGVLARVDAGEPGTPRSEYGRIVASPDDGPGYSDALGTVRTFTGELITVPMLKIDVIGEPERPIVAGLETRPPTQYENLELNEAQWSALKRAYAEGFGSLDSRVKAQTVKALARRGLVVSYSWLAREWRGGFGQAPLERLWHAEITALGRQAWEHHSKPAAPAEPKRVEIPGLGRSVPVREEPVTPRVPKGVHLMKEGFPEGRYAIEIDGQVHCFWFKYNSKTFMEETRYRKDDKWVSVARYVPEWKRAIEIIKSDSYTQAVRYGTETEHCSNCGRKLTRADSRKRGLGKDCAMEEIHKETLRRLFGDG